MGSEPVDAAFRHCIARLTSPAGGNLIPDFCFDLPASDSIYVCLAKVGRVLQSAAASYFCAR